MKKVILLTIAVALLMSVTSFAAPGRILRASKALELSDTQIEQIKEAGYKHKKNMIDLKAKLQQLKLDLKHSMGKIDADTKELLNLQKQLSEQRAALAESRLKHQLDIREMLSEHNGRRQTEDDCLA